MRNATAPSSTAVPAPMAAAARNARPKLKRVGRMDAGARQVGSRERTDPDECLLAERDLTGVPTRMFIERPITALDRR